MPIAPNTAGHKHQWKVVGVACVPPTLEVDCSCGAQGGVSLFSPREWANAFYASSKPFLLKPEREVDIYADSN